MKMKYKFSKFIIFFLFLSLLLLSIVSCGRKENLNPNIKPTITITSSFGADSLSAVDDSLLFQQTIFWRANDIDGVVEFYAFRISNGTGDYLETPGYDLIDADGWIYHYQPGADENIPMNDPDASLTIWTDQVHATINFPANSNGDSTLVVSLFEVKCVDDRGEESIPAQKYFNSFSMKPTVLGASSKGDIDGKTIGLGIIFEFSILDNDPYIGDVADHFEFMLQKRTPDNNIVPEPSYGEWISTKDQDDIYRFYLTQNSIPALTPNSFINDEPVDSTLLIMQAVDLAGIVSEPDTIAFLVKDVFAPGSLIYIEDTFILGENHYVTYRDELIGQVIPFEQFSDEIHYSTPFWIDRKGEFSVINSSDLKIYLHWGWHGEYEENYPFGKIEGALLDEQTDVSYYSEIMFFDLRLDDEPYFYPPFPPSNDNLITDNDGKEWLRVPAGNSIDQETIITGLEDGLHKFEMRVVDLQGRVDDTPAELNFKIIAPIPKADKQGVLILDDDPAHPTFAPEETLDERYLDFLSGYNGNIDQLDRVEIYEMIHSDSIDLGNLHFDKAVLSPTNLQAYKLVIYHSDNQTVESNFYDEYDVLNLYLKKGGNLLFSSGSILKITQEQLIENEIPILEDYFGLPLAENVINIPMNENSEANFLRLNFFITAVSEMETYSDINLELPSFVNLVTSKEGLGPVAFFDNFDAEILFSFGSKEPETGTNFENWDDQNDVDQYPSLDQFIEFNGKTVALRKVTENNNCYIFGFPLSFMEIEDVKNMIENILSELE